MRRKTNLKFYEVCELRKKTRNKENEIQVSEIMFSKSAKRCCRLDHIRNEGVREEIVFVCAKRQIAIRRKGNLEKMSNSKLVQQVYGQTREGTFKSGTVPRRETLRCTALNKMLIYL